MEIEKNKEEKISTLIEDLTSLENYARDLLYFLPLPICLVSPMEIILEANTALEKISGYKIEEIIGKPVEDFFAKEEIEKLLKETREKSFTERKEINIFTKNKREIMVSASTMLRKSEGEIIGYFLGFFDLTEIKKKEKELQIKVKELEKFHKLAVGRELKMIELKKEIKTLKKEPIKGPSV